MMPSGKAVAEYLAKNTEPYELVLMVNMLDRIARSIDKEIARQTRNEQAERKERAEHASV